MKVALVAFHIDVGPLVDHNCERTSMRDDGFFIRRRCFGDAAGCGR